MNVNEVYWAIAQTSMVVPKAEGMPGTAKTKTVEAFARATGRPIYTLIGSLREPADVGGYPYPIQVEAVKDGNGKETKVYMALVPPKWAMDCHDGRPWIVFIDELTTCPPAVQAALLRVIAEKYVGDLPLPQETWILCACNPAGVAANGFELEPPMANRLYHHRWVVDADAWDKGMLAWLAFPEPHGRLPLGSLRRSMAKRDDGGLRDAVAAGAGGPIGASSVNSEMDDGWAARPDRGA